MHLDIADFWVWMDIQTVHGTMYTRHMTTRILFACGRVHDTMRIHITLEGAGGGSGQA